MASCLLSVSLIILDGDGEVHGCSRMTRQYLGVKTLNMSCVENKRMRLGLMML